jgi:hypothetical protein
MADPKSAYTALLQATDSHARPRLTAQEQKILTLLALEEETRLECSLAEAQAGMPVHALSLPTMKYSPSSDSHVHE